MTLGIGILIRIVHQLPEKWNIGVHPKEAG